MFLDDDVGTLLGDVGEQVDHAGEWDGKDAGAVAVERPVDDVGLRPRTDEEHDASSAPGIVLQRRHLRGIESLDVEHPDGIESPEIEGGQRPGRLHPRLEAGRRARSGGQRRGEIKGIAGPRRRPWGGIGQGAVDEQDVDPIDDVDDERPGIVGRKDVGRQTGLDDVAARLLEADVEPLHGAFTGRDLGNADRRPANAVFTELDGHVTHRARAVVANAHLERHDDPGGGHPTNHPQPLDCQIAAAAFADRPLPGAIDEPDLGPRRSELTEDRHGVIGRFPLGGAEVAHDPDDLRRLRPAAIPEPFGRGSQRPERPGVGRGGLHRGQGVADPLHALRGHRLAGKIEPSGRVAGLRR